MKSFGTYTDCSNQSREIDEFHMHELLDRVDITSSLFNNHVADHAAAILFADDIEEIARKLRKLYQKIGEQRFRSVE